MTATLFGDPVPSPMTRRNDAPTSKVAAKMTDTAKGRRQVLAALVSLTDRIGSATDDDLREHPATFGMKHGSVTKRRLELERMDPPLAERIGVDFAGRRSRSTFRVTAAGRQEATK